MDHLSSPPQATNIVVDVEGVFNGGMIVSYNSPEGHEYRGALLCTSQCSTCRQCQPVLTKSVSSLANPLTVIHDHPYSDLHKYVRQISNEMPQNLFLHWNSVPQLDGFPSPSSPHKLHSRTQIGKVQKNCSPATVVASVVHPPDTYSWPYILKGGNNGQRTAKCVARMKLQEKQDTDHFASRNRQQRRKEAKARTKKTKNLQRRSLVSERRKRESPLSNDLDWFGGRDKRRPRSLPPLSTIAKFPLKKLSIPINRIPVRVRKKKGDSDIPFDARSRSSSYTTVDSPTEPSSTSRTSSSPLNNIHSMAYAIR